MDVDMNHTQPSSAALPAQASTSAEASTSRPVVAPPPKPGRSLRARQSDGGAAGAQKRTPRQSGARVITNDELNRALFKLSPEYTASRRDELVVTRETELRAIVEEHDMAVKEKFHLERYISILEGWDPAEAKSDNSPVFMDYKRANHDLLNLVPSSTLPLAPTAGPSRSRPSGPSRQTRRQLHSKAEALGVSSLATAEPKSSSAAATGKGKAKATEVDEEQQQQQQPAEDAAPTVDAPPSKPSRKSTKANMPPPPVPATTKATKKSRRATIAAAEAAGPASPEPEEPAPPVPAKGKKRPRQSLPNLPAKKSRALSAAASASPTSSPAPTPTPARSPTPPPAPLPSLAHLPFPDPPERPRSRSRAGPSRITYTDPNQRPLAQPIHDGDLNPILESYILIEDTGPPLDLAALELRAQREGYIRNRVNWLQHQGRLMRLLDDDDMGPQQPHVRDKSHQKKPQVGPLPRQTDYQDSLMAHMVQVRNAMANEAKFKPMACKRIAKMIQAYWDHLENKDARARQLEERERKRKAKEVVKGLKKRWGLAVKIIRAKVIAAQKLEQDRLGKEHLQNMLQRSTGLLEGQREVIVGRDGDSDEEDDGATSDGTAEVSAAEDSEGEGVAEEDGGEDAEGKGEEAEATTEDAAEVSTKVEEDEAAVDGAEDASDRDDEASSSDGEDSDSESDSGDNMPQVDYRAMLGIVADEQPDAAEVEEDDEATADAPHGNGDAAPQSLVEIMSAESARVEPDRPPTPREEPSLVDPAPTAAVDPVKPTPAPPIGSQAETVALPPPPPSPLVDDDDIVMIDTMAMPEAELDEADLEMFDTRPGTPAVVATPPTAPEPAAVPVAAEPTIEEVAAAELVAPAPELVSEPAPPAPNGHGASSPASAAESLPPPRAPSRRIRQRQQALAASASPDPDANDAEFQADGSDIDAQDAQLDVEMNDATADGGDSEDEGLLADAKMPIEELLKRYGYKVPAAEEEAVPDAVEGDVVMEEETREGDAAAPTTTTEVKVDQSLTDEALANRQPSPPLIVEGKRQRKIRNVWTPPDTPQQQPGKPRKSKVQIVAPDTEESPADFSEEEDNEEVEMTEDEEDEEEEEDEDVEEEDPNAPRIRPPFLLRGTLRPYQQGGLEWLASLYANNMNGILADEMGLGKTIQTIALLGHLACDLGVWGQHLIIVPTSVILNWEMEFKKFLPGMKVLTYYGNQKERKEKRVGWHTENAWQVCITSYQIVLADQHIFRRKNWVYMILDEAHNIKNFRSQRWQTLLGFKTQRRLLLTGTPLQNNLMELWSLLYFLMPNGITADATAVVGFANHKEFTEWFSNPMDKAVEAGEQLDDETIETVSKLHTLLRPFILRRLKSEVETQLPGKFEHVVYCRLSKRQRFLYDEFMSRASTREALMSGGYLGVVNTLMQLRKVCNHPDLFEVRPVRTSLAMENGVVGDYEPTQLLVRRRLLKAHDEEVDLEGMNLVITAHEHRSGWVASARARLDASDKLPYAIEPVKKGRSYPAKRDTRTVEGWAKYKAYRENEASVARWRALRDVNRLRCQSRPIFGSTTLEMLTDLPKYLLPETANGRRNIDLFGEHQPPAAPLVASYTRRLTQVSPILDRFAVIPPNAVARDVANYALPGVDPHHPDLRDPGFDSLHSPAVRLQIAFPDASLLQYDCGKLQKLAEMLRDLKAEGHRVLIFTQMTRVLDILEIFLSHSGHRYLRLDGSTKIEDRQIITERFNSDPRIFCFIASSRSGGVGINLTGADTVFFYDSDWNPSMDRQCMDRAHRIGQTREVHIYRFVSSHTVEENMLKKANQKRLLDRVVIQDGDFTTEFFGKMDWRDMLDDSMRPVEAEAADGQSDDGDRIEDVDVEQEPEAEDAQATAPRLGQERELAQALAQVEDEEDAAAARVAQGEGEMDLDEFGGVDLVKKANANATTQTQPAEPAAVSRLGTEGPGTGTGAGTGSATPMGEDEYYDDEDEPGGVDEYMLRLVEWDWEYFSQL